MGRHIISQLFIDWQRNGTFTNETARLISASGSLRIAAPEESIMSPRGVTDNCTLVLSNHDGRYSPLNTSGALYSYISGGQAYHAPMYLTVSVDGGSNTYRQFTDVIKIPKENAPTYQETATVTIDCRSMDEKLLWQSFNPATGLIFLPTIYRCPPPHRWRQRFNPATGLIFLPTRRPWLNG